MSGRHDRTLDVTEAPGHEATRHDLKTNESSRLARDLRPKAKLHKILTRGGNPLATLDAGFAGLGPVAAVPSPNSHRKGKLRFSKQFVSIMSSR